MHTFSSLLLYMTKREAKKLMTDSNLIDKKSVFFKKNIFVIMYKNG